MCSLMPVRGGLACLLALASAVPATLSGEVAAQTAPQAAWPSKPVRVVISFPPGGSVDVVPRMVAAKLVERLGQPWIFENRPGAGGQIAVDVVLKSQADGYTFFAGPTGAIAINPSLYRKLNYDPLKDFAAIVPLARAPMVLIVPITWPGTLREFIAETRARPGQMNYGHGGNGTAMHLVGELFRSSTGASLTPVPFKTSGEAMSNTAGGQLNAAWVDSNFALIGIRGARVRALAVSGRERTPVMPDVPTVSESGTSALDALGWFGFFAPAGVPADVVAKLNAEVRIALQTPDVRERILATGNEPWWAPAEEFSAFVRAEIPKWARAVKESGASAD